MNYTIKNNILEIEISTLGAELQSIKKDGTEYLWQGNKESWKNKATNIFPYVGKMTNGKYTFKGECYEMGAHGFARNTEFLAEKISDTKIIFKIENNEDTLKCFPFKFEFYIIYEILENLLKISYEVLNKDEKTMYFGLGGHPGFNIPLENELNFEDYYLEFEKECQPINYNVTEKGHIKDTSKYPLFENKILNLKHNLFDNDALIFENMDKTVTLKSDKSNKKVVVSFPDMKYLGIWHTPKKEVPFVCIEPWTSLPSRDAILEDFETQPNLVRVNSSEKYINNWEIKIF